MGFVGFLFSILTCHLLFASDFVVPKGLTQNDIPTIVQSFTTGFLTRTPYSLLNDESPSSQLGYSVDMIETEKFSKLGLGSPRKDVSVQEIFFAKRLPLDVELGFQTSLMFVDRDINKFGGYVRWGMLNYPWGAIVFIAHGASGSFRNMISTNIYGGSLNLDLSFGPISASLGTGFIRSTNTFDENVFLDSPVADQDVTYGKQYAHQSVKVSYLWDRISITGQGDWIKDFFGSMNLGYLF